VNRAQFEHAAQVLRENPPEITGDTLRVVNGKDCHCSLGKLGVAAGVPRDAIASWGRSLSKALYDTFGITPATRPDGTFSRMSDESAIYLANDRISESTGTPERRAEVVIQALEGRVDE
jgi:hypothetical protein